MRILFESLVAIIFNSLNMCWNESHWVRGKSLPLIQVSLLKRNMLLEVSHSKDKQRNKRSVNLFLLPSRNRIYKFQADENLSYVLIFFLLGLGQMITSEVNEPVSLKNELIILKNKIKKKRHRIYRIMVELISMCSIFSIIETMISKGS